MNRLLSFSLLYGLLAGLGFAQTQLSSSEALGNALLTGGEYILQAGRYELNSGLTLSRDLSITGEGKDLSIIVLKAAPIGLSVEEAIRLEFQNISFEYVGEHSADIFNIGAGLFSFSDCAFRNAKFIEPEDDDGIWYGDALYLYGEASGTIRNCEFSGHGLAAIQTDGTSQLELLNSSFSQNSSALGVFGSSSLIARQNVFENHSDSDAVVSTYGDAKLALSENQFLNNQSNALLAYENSIVDLNNNVFDTNGNADVDAVFIDDNATGTLSENQFLNNPRIALTVSGSASAIVSNNLFENNGNAEGYAALSLEMNATANLTDNTFRNNTGGALTMLDSAEAVMENNTVSDNLTWVSIYLEGSSKLSMASNLITQSEGDGIYATDQAELISDGDSYLANTEFGIRLQSQARATISNGIFENNRSGVFLGDNSYASISASIFKNNQRTGIGFTGNSDGFARSNLIEGHVRNGIVAAGSSTPMIENNQLSNNSYGILLAETTTATIRGNILKDNVHGLYTVSSSSPDISDNTFETNEQDQTEGAEPQYE